MTVPAEALTEQVSEACRADTRIVAALTYGAVPQGRADAWSDAEFWFFIRQDADFDGEVWLRELLPELLLVAHGEWGLIAILPGLVRLELHAVPEDQMSTLASWPGLNAPVERTLVLDRDGRLGEILRNLPERSAPESEQAVSERFANWWVLGFNVLRRGELERAYDALTHARWQLLWLLRLRHEATELWGTPLRRAEVELPPEAIQALARTASGAVTFEALRVAYANAWRLAVALTDHLPAGLRREVECLIG